MTTPAILRFKLPLVLYFAFLGLMFISVAQETDTVINIRPADPPRIIYYQSTPQKSNEPFASPSFDPKRRNEIKTLAGSSSHTGGFFGFSFRSTEFNNETMVLGGFRTGWIVNRTLGIGFEGHGVIPTTKYMNIDAIDEAYAVGGYGGMFLELILFSNQVIHLTFPASAGPGYMSYITTSSSTSSLGTDKIVDRDMFWYCEPGANVEINISRSVRLAVGMSKRFTQDLTLRSTSADAFDNLSYYVTLKLGSF